MSFRCFLAILIVLLSTQTIALAQRTAPPWPLVNTNIDAVQHLRMLGYWTSDRDSLSDPANKQALIAFQKVEGLKRTGTLTDATYQKLLKASTPNAKDSVHVFHIEIDLNRQVLFLVDSLDHVTHILPVSTGSGKYFESEGNGRYAITPRGKFKVYYRISGWRKSPLGLLYDPLYIHNGVAIHGAPLVPAYPASHGCIRVPMYAASELFQKTPIGTIVIIFGENPKLSKN